MRIFTAAFLALAASAAFAQIDLNKTVMTINGDKISNEEYYGRMEFLPGVARVLDSGNVVRLSPGMLTIIQLIDDHLLIQLAKDHGVTPTDQEVDDALKDAETANPNFKTEWLNSGRSEGQLREAIRLNVIGFKLQTEGITVSDQEVDNYYHTIKTPGLTYIPRKVQLRLIAVKDQAQEKNVDDNLAAGHKFEDVAKSDSDDVTAQNGGELGTVLTDRLPKEVTDAIDKTKISEVTTWVDESFGNDQAGSPINYHVKYLIENKTPEEPIPFNDGLKERIRRQMMLDRGKSKNNVQQELEDERKKAHIVISAPQFAQEYHDFMKQYFNEDVNVSGGS